MATFVMTHQITSLDNFDLDTSFEDFVRETQHKLLNLPVEQCEEEQVVEDTYDLSSFMAVKSRSARKLTFFCVWDFC